MKHIPIATRYIVILGPTYADGTEQDYETVNKLQVCSPASTRCAIAPTTHIVSWTITDNRL